MLVPFTPFCRRPMSEHSFCAELCFKALLFNVQLAIPVAFLSLNTPPPISLLLLVLVLFRLD